MELIKRLRLVLYVETTHRVVQKEIDLVKHVMSLMKPGRGRKATSDQQHKEPTNAEKKLGPGPKL